MQKYKGDFVNWDDIRVFMAVVRGQSLTAAARELRLDPATIGRRVGRLERDLGATLFAKSPQGYVLTEEGMRVHDRARQAEDAVSAMARNTASDPGLSGQVRIGAPDGCATFLLPQVCAAVRREHPGLEFQIISLPWIVNLSRREADLAITVSPPVTGRLIVQKIADYKLHFACHRDLTREPDALATVGYIPDMIFDRELDYLRGTGRSDVKMASNSVTVQLAMLRQKAGLGIVHDFALPFVPELVRVLQDRVSLTRAYHLVRHEADRRSDRLTTVAGLLVQALKAEINRLEAQAAGKA